MVTQGLANDLDEYDIVAVARVAGKNLRLIENLIEANIFNLPGLAGIQVQSVDPGRGVALPCTPTRGICDRGLWFGPMGTTSLPTCLPFDLTPIIRLPESLTIPVQSLRPGKGQSLGF